MLHENGIEQNMLYQQSVAALQEGRWQDAIDGFESLLEVYPDDEELRDLLREARDKASLSKIGMKRRPASKRKILPIVAILVALAMIGAGFWIASAYRTRIAQNAKAASLQRQVANHITAGAKALAEGRYADAEKEYQKALTLDPGSQKAKDGLAKAKDMESAQRLFEAALSARKGGDLQKALELLKELQEEHPGFRDVSGQISEIENQLRNRNLLTQADDAFEKKDWARAAQMYSSFAASNPDDVDDKVESRLYTCYMEMGEKLIGDKNASTDSIHRAAQMFRNALRWKPRDSRARAYLDMIERYQEGEAALQAGNLDVAISTLRGLYLESPDFLGGKICNDLYSAYLSRGERYEQSHDYTLAYQQYILASKLPVQDKSEAKRRMLMLGLFLTPTPTPLPTPTPTPTPAATPTPGPLSWYKGDIAFLSDRSGKVGLYVMPPSGKWVRHMPDEYMEEYKKLRDKGRLAPGGKARVYAEGVGANKSVQLFIWRYDIPQSWGPRRQLTDSPQPDYDPVWSPTGEWIAFVSERTGNDEIWIVHPDGTGLKQLTKNTWEWDKHPSWSPDGKKIVFWSNRGTGRKQIWVMNQDGSDQHNISNDKWNDWDPIWIK